MTITQTRVPCERCQTPTRREDREVVLPARVRPLIASRYFCPACEGAPPLIRPPNAVYPGMMYA